jgi:hypothetical protein
MALAINRTLIVGVRRLGSLNDYEDLDPVAVSQVVTVTIKSNSAKDLFPQFGGMGGKDFAFPEDSSSYLTLSGEVGAGQQSLLAIHTDFSAKDGLYAGWGIALPEDIYFDAHRFRDLYLQVTLGNNTGDFEIKLKDANGAEPAVSASDYSSLMNGPQEIVIPLEDFAALDDQLDLRKVQVLTIGFNQDFGDATVGIGKIAFK